MNIELAEQIIGVILMHPERLDMASYVGRWSGDDTTSYVGRWSGDDTIGGYRNEWPCGTTACIAGHAAILSAPAETELMAALSTQCGPGSEKEGRPLIEWLAIEALGITGEVADVLFFEPEDDEAVMALKFLAGNPDATGGDLRVFLAEGRLGLIS
jgi:hypothetical protein